MAQAESKSTTANPDGPLLDLIQMMSVASAAHFQADEREVALRHAANAQYPEAPPNICFRPAGTDELRVMSRDMIEKVNRAQRNLMGTKGNADAECSRRFSELERWETECRKIDEAQGVPAAEAAADRAMQEIRRLDAIAVATPARTLDGLLIKFALALGSIKLDVLESASAPDVWEEMASSALRDLMTLQSGSDPMMFAQIIAALEPLDKAV